ncbi:MAG: phosphatase PAP2 family protein [Nannocystales bacterium]
MCRSGTPAREARQFGFDLGLSLGGASVSALGTFAIGQVEKEQWVPALDRRVPTNGSAAAEITSDVLLYGASAAAGGWVIFATATCWNRYSLHRSRVRPLLEVLWPSLWTIGLTGMTKAWSGRPRPYTRGSLGFTGADSDHQSFPSGHTSTAAVLVTVTVSSGLRLAKRRLRPLPRLLIAAVGAELWHGNGFR